MLTRQKVIDRRRRRQPAWTESALGQQPGFEAVAIEYLAGNDVDPKFIVTAVDELQSFLESLDEERRSIALLRMDGFGSAEIAERMGISLRSVERKLPLIKKKWQQRVNEDGSFVKLDALRNSSS